MWPTVLFALLTVAICGWIFTTFRQTRKVHALERSKEEIQVEETLVFDFLHGLGEAFRETIKPHDLHRLIVEGATRILDAHGGALYLVDRSGNKLVPVFLSNGCPPLVAVPGHVLHHSATTPAALEGFLRMHNIAPGEGLIGTVWQTAQPVILTDVKEVSELAHLRETALGTGSLMATPLLYGKQNMGVLALGNRPMGAPFSQSDFVVFKSIAEQSAFALYNAIIYSEANEKKRLDHDLEIARDIQRTLLPEKSPSIPGFEIAGINIPARQVSGDYFDYLRVDEHHLGLAIADVSGKGVPASLIMAICRSVLRSQAPQNPSPADVLKAVNRQLYPDIKEDMFISMAYLVVDHSTGVVTIARAGHDAPLLYRGGVQTVELIKPPGMVVGIDSGSVFDRITNDFTIPMEQDDCLVLYTDGVTEALDAEGFEFGIDRMIQSVRASARHGASAIITRLIDDVRNFVGAHPQNDDITSITIRKT
jgi:sigma-B regulation protein RsbU (phosphoserine phosphatase)